MNATEAISLCERYSMGHPVRYQRSGGGTRTPSFSLQTTSGTWFARKRHHGYSATQRIAFDHAAMRFLHDQGAAVVTPRLAADGNSFFQDNGEVWEIFPEIRNRPFHAGDVNDVRLLGRALAKLHLCGRTFEDRYDKLGPRGETSPGELKSLISTIRTQTSKCASVLARYDSWISSAANELNDAAYQALPHTLVHGDVQPANVLMDGQSVAAFVDFDWCAWRPRIYDLAFAILLCCSAHESPIRGQDIWSLTQPPNVHGDCVRELLGACGDGGWPLEIPERQALRAQVVLSWCHCRIAGAMKVDPERREEFLSRPPFEVSSLLPCAIA